MQLSIIVIVYIEARAPVVHFQSFLAVCNAFVAYINFSRDYVLCILHHTFKSALHDLW